MSSSEITLDFSVIRGLRKQAEMTLEAVSQSSGISIATLSKLERNQHLVEIDTLYRLARVFGLSTSDLMRLAESCSAHAKQSRHYTSGPFAFERVDFRGIHCFRATARAGDTLKKPEAHGDEFEICWVHTGRIYIELPREKHTLRSGQALQFDAVLEHTYTILEDCDLTILHLEKSHRF